MADVNRVILIGRLTRDPEGRSFGNGGRVANFGFAVGSRKFNQQTKQWEDGDTMFIDCEAFNRGEFGKLADRIEQYLKKGTQVYLEGRLKLDQWDDKTTGQKRSKHKLVVEVMQMLEGRGTAEGGRGGSSSRASHEGAPYDTASIDNDYEMGSVPESPTEEKLPF